MGCEGDEAEFSNLELKGGRRVSCHLGRGVGCGGVVTGGLSGGPEGGQSLHRGSNARGGLLLSHGECLP
jgi:hypothetical protein